MNIDDRGDIHAADRRHTGLHAVGLTGAARQIVRIGQIEKNLAVPGPC